MLTPRPARHAPASMSRRAVLLGLAAAALAGCTSGLKVRRDGPRRSGPDQAGNRAEDVDPDVALAATALALERQTLLLVEATQSRHERLRVLLEPAAASHRAHIDVLAEAAPTEDPTPTSAPGTVRVRRSPVRALVAVVEAEDEAGAAGRRHAFAAESGPFARLLASMAASAGQHAAVLREATIPGGRGR